MSEDKVPRGLGNREEHIDQPRTNVSSPQPWDFFAIRRQEVADWQLRSQEGLLEGASYDFLVQKDQN